MLVAGLVTILFLSWPGIVEVDVTASMKALRLVTHDEVRAKVER
jgi:hypothetical protein